MVNNVNASTNINNSTGIVAGTNGEAEFNQVVANSNQVSSAGADSPDPAAAELGAAYLSLMGDVVAPSGILGGGVWNTETHVILYVAIVTTDDLTESDPGTVAANMTHFLLIRDKVTKKALVFTLSPGNENIEVGKPLFSATPLGKVVPSRVAALLPEQLNNAMIFANTRAGLKEGDAISSVNAGLFWKIKGNDDSPEEAKRKNAMGNTMVNIFGGAVIDSVLGEGTYEAIDALETASDAAILLGAGSLAYKIFLSAGKEGVKEYFRSKVLDAIGSGTPIAGIVYRETLLMNGEFDFYGENPFHFDDYQEKVASLYRTTEEQAEYLNSIMEAQPEARSFVDRALSWFINDVGRGSDIVPGEYELPDGGVYIIKENGDIFVRDANGIEWKVGNVSQSSGIDGEPEIISTQTIETESGDFFYIHEMSDGSTRTSEHIYEDGRLVRIIDTNIDEAGNSQRTIYDFSYDADGNIAETRITNSNNEVLILENGEGGVIRNERIDFFTPDQVAALEDSMIVVDIEPPAQLGTVIITDEGAIGYNGNGKEIRFDNNDGTKVQMWENDEGTHIAISYGEDILYVISSDGRRTVYIDGVATSLPEAGNSELIEQFRQYAESVRNGARDVPAPAFAKAFPETDQSLKYRLYGSDSENVTIQTVMTSNGLAKVVYQDGKARYVAFADGRISDLEKLVGEDGKLASGSADENELERLSQILDVNEVLFEVWSFGQMMEGSLKTWEDQYKPQADKLMKDLEALLKRFPDHPMAEQINNFIIAYKNGEPAFRFLANITGVLTGDNDTVLDNAKIDEAVDALLGVLKADGRLLSGEADEFKANLASVLYSFQMIKNAHAAFTSEGGISGAAGIGFTGKSIEALGALAALGIVDKDFAKYVSLVYGGTALFLRVREGLDGARNDLGNKEAYDRAIGASVSLIATLGKLNVIDKRISDAVRGSYATYNIIESGIDLYQGWNDSNITTAERIGSFKGLLSALKVMGEIGWLSENDMENLGYVTDILTVIDAAYNLSSLGDAATFADNANFTMALVNVIARNMDLNYDQQAGVAILNIIVNAVSGNFVGTFLGMLGLAGIFGASSAERRARREARRPQLADVIKNIDVDGNGISIDDVKYEFNVADDFLYLVGNPEENISGIEYEYETVGLVHVGTGYNAKGEVIYKYYDDAGSVFSGADSVAQRFAVPVQSGDYVQTSYKPNLRVTIKVDKLNILTVKRVVGVPPSMQGYVNEDDIRVIYNYSNNKEKWVRDQYLQKNRTITTKLIISEEQFRNGVAVLGGNSGSISPNQPGAALDYINNIAPMPSDVKIAYTQQDKNLGFTQYLHVNDDNGDGVVGEGDILDRVTTFINIRGEVDGDNSSLIQLLNENGETYMAYAIPAGRGEGETPYTNEELIALAPTTIAGRAFAGQQVDPLSLGLKAENEVVIDKNNNDMSYRLKKYFELTSDDSNGAKYFLSNDRRLVFVYDKAGDSVTVYNSLGATAQYNNIFGGQPPSKEKVEGALGYALAQRDLRIFEPVANASLNPFSKLLNWAQNIESKHVNFASLGLDSANQNIGVMDFGGAKFFGYKDYSKAPLSEDEKLIYLSYAASLAAKDPEAYANSNIGGDTAEEIAISARLYVANNTPINEFLANYERPTGIIFDGRAYLIANPDIVEEIGIDKGLFERLKTGTMTESDLKDGHISKLLEDATIHYLKEGRFENRIFAAYQRDLNGDVRRDENGNVISGEIDIINISNNGQVTATVRDFSNDRDNPTVTEYIMKNGEFTEMRRDIDGDGIADTILAPEEDGGVWQVELSSNGNIGRARTVREASLWALSGDALQAGSYGITSDVNGDGIADNLKILDDGSAWLALGSNEVDEAGNAVDGQIFTGETIGDVLAQANEQSYLAWVANSDDRILAIGTNLSAARLAAGSNLSPADMLRIDAAGTEEAKMLDERIEEANKTIEYITPYAASKNRTVSWFEYDNSQYVYYHILNVDKYSEELREAVAEYREATTKLKADLVGRSDEEKQALVDNFNNTHERKIESAFAKEISRLEDEIKAAQEEKDNLGTFLDPEILARNNGDVGLALREYIETRREELLTARITEIEEAVEENNNRINYIRGIMDLTKDDLTDAYIVSLSSGVAPYEISTNDRYSNALNQQISDYNRELHRMSREYMEAIRAGQSEEVTSKMLSDFNQTHHARLNEALEREVEMLERSNEILQRQKSELGYFRVTSDVEKREVINNLNNDIHAARANIDMIESVYEYNMLRTTGSINSGWLFSQRVEIKDFYSEQLKADIEAYNAKYSKVSAEIENLIFGEAEMRAAVVPYKIELIEDSSGGVTVMLFMGEDSEGIVLTGENAEKIERLIAEFVNNDNETLYQAYERELAMLRQQISDAQAARDNFVPNPVMGDQTLGFLYDRDMLIGDRMENIFGEVSEALPENVVDMEQYRRREGNNSPDWWKSWSWSRR